MPQYTFSGHDTFHCRQFWLKKGFDLAYQGKKFNDYAVVNLGVGKNMVNAVRHWMRAFNLLNTNSELTTIAHKIFSDNGYDPYLEDEGTLWLLHYLIVESSTAPIFHLIFNGLREEKPEFNEEQFLKYINKLGKYNEATLKKDFNVFIRTYYGKKDEKDLEESFSGILTELNLIETKERTYFDYEGQLRKRQNWLIERKHRQSIPAHIILFAIADNKDYGISISFEDLYDGTNTPGNIFALNKEGLMAKLEALQDLPYDITFSNEAGIREVQFKEAKPDIFNILSDYYER